MKYSQIFGAVACIALIGACFLPWSYVAEIKLQLSGFEGGDRFGKPGLFNVIVCCVMFFLFLVNKIWAKRTNVFIAALNIAWSARNYFLVSSCDGGICPQKQAGLYLLLLLSLFILVMTFLPPVKIAKHNYNNH